MTTRHISYFGGVDDGDGLGGGTDNSGAIQASNDWLQTSKGGTVDYTPLNTGWYLQTEPVTLFHPDNTSHHSYVLRAGGSRIDATLMTGADTAWTIGAASLNELMEEGDWRIDLKLKGPEADGFNPEHSPSTQTTGFKFQYIVNADLNGLTANGFRRGAHLTWALYNRGYLNVRRNILGCHLDAVANFNKLSIFGVNCRTSVALSPMMFTDEFDKGKINGNKIEDVWAEGSDVALWLDGGQVQGTPIVFGNEFEHLYIARMKKSAVRSGYAFSFNSGSSTTSPGEISNNRIASKLWNPPEGGYAPGRHAIDIAPGLRTGELEVDIPVPWGTPESFNNRPAGGAYRLWGPGLYRGAKYVHFDALGNIVPPVNG